MRIRSMIFLALAVGLTPAASAQTDAAMQGITEDIHAMVKTLLNYENSKSSPSHQELLAAVNNVSASVSNVESVVKAQKRGAFYFEFGNPGVQNQGLDCEGNCAKKVVQLCNQFGYGNGRSTFEGGAFVWKAVCWD